MDEIYSLTLLVSLVAGAGALVVALLERIGAIVPSGVSWVVPSCIVAGLGFLIAFVVHLAFGHTPGGPNALSPGAFISEHPSFLPAVTLPIAAWLVRPGLTRSL